MIRNYLKTAGRNLLRNKLFSAINIAGLAISMSVGLLMIAFLLDLWTYDRFHEHGDRIYRITSVVTTNGDQGKFATTDPTTAQLIRDKVSGVEDVTVLRPDFSKDAAVGADVVPVKGYWADPLLFRVFTFPLLEGNPETALRDPYSVVLTQSTARKLFGGGQALGRSVRFDSVAYQVTGVMQDVPFFSHIQFEALASLSTLGPVQQGDARRKASSDFVYLRLPPAADLTAVQTQLDAVAQAENRAGEQTQVQLELMPLYDIVVGETLRRSEGGGGATGPHLSPRVLWLLGGLALVVILSACFNYTNLSMARAMRRFKEIGLRKAIGAGKAQVRQQFLAESVLIALAALVLSFILFLGLRPLLINLAPEMQRTVQLRLTLPMVIAFVLFAGAVGLLAGLMPALFFARVSAISALRNVSSVKVFRHMTLRRALVVLQYTVTLIFITTTAIGYVQYKHMLAFDLGFRTENILNIDMQGNKPDALMKTLGEMPEVTAVSRSLIVTSIGNAWGGYVKHTDSRDSALVMTNHVDENYLTLHQYKLLAGQNFRSRPVTADAATEIIVNQQFLKRFNLGINQPEQAIGKEVTFRNFRGTRRLSIVGVMKDVHYGKVDNLIGPVAFMPWAPGDPTVVNVKIQGSDPAATRARIEAAWQALDRVHPLKAQFYDEAIEAAYSEFSMLIRIIALLSFFSISIASMGLFGMVSYTTETRLKELRIRKVLGASGASLFSLLSRGFIVQLSASALIALPVTYLFFEKMILTRFPYHTPIGLTELVAGLLAVLLIAFLMIGSQTLKASKTNPTDVLKGE
nr:ABC transporter permease [uncultured Arsenicibacter sp.]